MKIYLAILAVMFFIIPSHNLRAQGTQSLNIDGERNLSHVPLMERMAAQQKNGSGAIFNKQSQRNSGLNKKTAPNSQVYYPDSLTLYSMKDTILITASYDQTGSTTQRLIQYYSNGQWINYSLDTWTYFGPNSSVDLEQMWLNGQWVNSTSDSSTFDAKGNMLVHLFTYWSGKVRRDSILSFRTYDANGSMLTDLGEYMTNGQWTNHDQTIYTNDNSGNSLSSLFQMWIGGMWVNQELFNYTYDGNGHMLTRMMQGWNGQWDNETLSTYTYDPNGNMMSFLIQTSANGQWTNYMIDMYTYDANGKMLTDLLKASTNGAWMNGVFTTYTIDPNGNMVNELIQEWLNGLWTNYRQSTFTYDALGNERTGNNTMWSGSSWVPADYNFSLAVSGSTYNSTGYRIIISWILANTTDVPSDRSTIVKDYSLSQNYPNPFNPSTTISFRLPSKSFVSLKVFDIMGREVATIASEELSAGAYTRQWNAAKLSSGIYFYRLQAGNYLETKKLILLK
jgi:hypothetical protein